MKTVQRIIFLFLIVNLSVNAQNNNKLDSNGKKDGLWKGFYQDSKRPKYEGTFAHGQEVGLFQFFDDTKVGSVIATRDFSAGDGSAYTIFYDQSKNKVSEGRVVNKQFEGLWKYYHQESAVVMTTENYKNGKLNGLRTVYYLSGKVAEETHYKDGLKEGPYKKYSENDIILESASFKADQYDGEAIYKEADGKVVSHGKFLNGKKVGIWKFFENGKLQKETNMSAPLNTNKVKAK
ncbi:hypothetical protein FFWV33_18820 [Flavobacterium faecale]|uniref:Preprotein translocase YidC n=1 Tax=Flavobacterium faecale TaxID=1355330 RepID=A0A2S1LIX2_9FLAO|nr:hypothetical protein [Flavobacterium faecale]AWG23436.1 hypothetical protein FFWV33_18820 [Flavobacterium faecale]